MAGVNKEGNRRGLCFTSRWDTCKDCGAPLWKDAAKRQLCASCRAKHAEIQKEKQRARSMERYYRMKGERQRFQNLQKQQSTECLMWKYCRYGSDRGGCAYAAITGKLRSSGGEHRIIDGKCDLYQQGRKKRGGWHDIYASETNMDIGADNE